MANKTATNSGSLPVSKAYMLLLLNKELCLRLGMARQTIMNRRMRARKGLFPTVAVMRRFLKAAGWGVQTEEQWGPKPGARLRIGDVPSSPAPQSRKAASKRAPARSAKKAAAKRPARKKAGRRR